MTPDFLFVYYQRNGQRFPNFQKDIQVTMQHGSSYFLSKWSLLPWAKRGVLFDLKMLTHSVEPMRVKRNTYYRAFHMTRLPPNSEEFVIIERLLQKL